MEKTSKKTFFYDKLIKLLETDIRQKYQEDRNTLLGALIKRKRESQRLTQGEVSENICSISYLSKIEANKVPINEAYSSLLMERLEINKKDIILLENANEYLDRALDCFYSGDKDSYLKLYYDVEDAKESLAAEVIKLGFYVLIDDKESADETIDFIFKSIKSLDGLLLKIFALFSGEFLLKNGEYDIALNTLTILDKESVSKSRLSLAVKDLLFRIYAKENRVMLAIKYYYDLLINYIEEVNQPRIFYIKSFYLFLLLENGEYEEIIREERNIKHLKKYCDANAINYLFGYSFFKVQQISKADYYFDKIKEESIYYSRMLNIKYLYSTEKEKLYDKAIKINEKSRNFYSNYFIKNYTNTISVELFKNDDYNKAFALSSIKERIDLYQLEISYLSSIARYKEAHLIENKINKIINR